MAYIDMDLLKHVAALGGHPERFFVDEHDHVFRVVEHTTGKVVGVLKPDGTMGPFRVESGPNVPPVEGDLNIIAPGATTRG